MGGIFTAAMGVNAPVNIIKPKAGEPLSIETDLNVTVSEPLSEINEQLFTVSKSYAFKVIREVEVYVRNKTV